MKSVHSITCLSILLLAIDATALSAQQPEGLEPYLGMKDQFTLALPAGWTVYDQGRLLSGTPGKTGLPIIFSAELIDGQAMMSGDKDALKKVRKQVSDVEVGAIPGFILNRLPARKGMSCKGFDKKAQTKLMELLGTDPMFGQGRTTREKPHAEPAVIGGCQGLRVKGKGTTSTGAGKTLDVYAVSDGEVVFLFMLLNLDEHYEKNVGTFEKVMSTLKLAVSPKGGK